MLTSIKVQNFKLFKDFTLDNIPRILLLGGKNNCGKTTALESLFLPLNCQDPGMFLKLLAWRGLNTLSNNPKSLSAPAYHNFDLTQPVHLQYTLNKVKKYIKYEFVPSTNIPLIPHPARYDHLKIPRELTGNLGEIKISYKIQGQPSQSASLKHSPTGIRLIDRNQSLGRFNNGTKAVFIMSTAANLSEQVALQYGELDRLNQTAPVLEALQILEPRLKALSIIPSGSKPLLHGDTGMGEKIPLPLMGQGINRLALILFAIFNAKDGIVLVDEMENGFHHSFLTSLWQVIATPSKENNTQIIATTHSQELITAATKGIPEDLKKDFQYTRIERNKDQFKTKNYDLETLNTAFETNMETR